MVICLAWLILMPCRWGRLSYSPHIAAAAVAGRASGSPSPPSVPQPAASQLPVSSCGSSGREMGCTELLLPVGIPCWWGSSSQSAVSVGLWCLRCKLFLAEAGSICICWCRSWLFPQVKMCRELFLLIKKRTNVSVRSPPAGCSAWQNGRACPRSVIGSVRYTELPSRLSLTVCKGSKPESKMRSSQFQAGRSWCWHCIFLLMLWGGRGEGAAD